jgi:hypothetical protein
MYNSALTITKQRSNHGHRTLLHYKMLMVAWEGGYAEKSAKWVREAYIFLHTKNIIYITFLGVHALAWAKNTLWASPYMSVAFFPGTRQPPWSEAIAGTHCCNNVNWAHCCNNVDRGLCQLALLQQWPRITLLQKWPLMPLLDLLFPWLPCWLQHPWFGVSVYSKEYTFAILSTV